MNIFTRWRILVSGRAILLSFLFFFTTQENQALGKAGVPVGEIRDEYGVVLPMTHIQKNSENYIDHHVVIFVQPGTIVDKSGFLGKIGGKYVSKELLAFFETLGVKDLNEIQGDEVAKDECHVFDVYYTSNDSVFDLIPKLLANTSIIFAEPLFAIPVEGIKPRGEVAKSGESDEPANF